MNILRGVFFLSLFCLPFFVALDDSSVWDSNEAFYVQTPREMLERDEWLIPYFNGTPRLNKPPLTYWVVGIFYQLFEPALFWERLAMALLASGCLMAVFANGWLLFGSNVGLWAAGIFATTFRFLILSRRLAIEVLLLFCILWAIFWFLCWFRSQKSVYFFLSAVFFALAFLTKGPVALLPAVFLGLYVAFRGHLLRFLRAPWILGGLLFLIVSSSWYVGLGLRIGWGPVMDFFLQDNLSRFAVGGFGPERGAFYYLGVLLGDFFPWSFLLPAALLWFFLGGEEHSQRSKWLLLGLWMVTYLLFFSLSSSKQEYYILPLYPAAALAIARYLEKSRPPFPFLVLVASLTMVLGLALFAVAQLLFGQEWLWLPLLIMPLFLLGMLTRRYSLMGAGLALFYAAAFLLYLPLLEQFKPVPHLAETLRREVVRLGQDEYEAGYYRLASPSLVFYLNHPIHELFEAADAGRLLDSDTPTYLIVAQEHYQELEQASKRPLEIVGEHPKLYTTVRNLIQGLKGGRTDSLRESWTRPVYLVTSRGTR